MKAGVVKFLLVLVGCTTRGPAPTWDEAHQQAQAKEQKVEQEVKTPSPSQKSSAPKIKIYWKGQKAPPHETLIKVSSGGHPSSKNIDNLQLKVMKRASRHGAEAIVNFDCVEHTTETSGSYYSCLGDAVKLR